MNTKALIIFFIFLGYLPSYAAMTPVECEMLLTNMNLAGTPFSELVSEPEDFETITGVVLTPTKIRATRFGAYEFAVSDSNHKTKYVAGAKRSFVPLMLRYGGLNNAAFDYYRKRVAMHLLSTQISNATETVVPVKIASVNGQLGVLGSEHIYYDQLSNQWSLDPEVIPSRVTQQSPVRQMGLYAHQLADLVAEVAGLDRSSSDIRYYRLRHDAEYDRLALGGFAQSFVADPNYQTPESLGLSSDYIEKLRSIGRNANELLDSVLTREEIRGLQQRIAILTGDKQSTSPEDRISMDSKNWRLWLLNPGSGRVFKGTRNLVVYLLLVAREPIPAEMLVDWAKSDPLTIKLILSALHPVLKVEKRLLSTYFSISSPDFRAYLQTPEAEGYAGISVKDANDIVAE